MAMGLIRRVGARLGIVKGRSGVAVSGPGAPGWLVPGAAARWIGAGVSYYTPQMVEMIFRNALAGDLVSQWEMFDLMEATWPRLQKNLAQLKDAVVAEEVRCQAWRLKDEEASPEAEKRARLVEELIWGMEPEAGSDENDLEDTIRDLMDARGKGLSVLEVDWSVRQSSAGGTVIGPRCTRWVHPSWYGYPSGAQDGRLMLRAGAGNGLQSALTPTLSPGRGSSSYQEFPANKFLIGVCKARTGHPLGNAMLHVLGWWWAASNFTAEWFLNLAQVFGQPLRWATYAEGMSSADQAKLRLMLENMGSAAWGAFPEGTSVELKEAATNARDNPQKVLLDTADKVCDLVVLGQTLTSDVQTQQSGSRALGEVHERVLGGVEYACAKWVCKTLQQLVRMICVLNFGDTRECPYLLPPGEEGDEDAGLADTLVKLNQAGLEVTDEAIPELGDRLGVEVQRKAAPVTPLTTDLTDGTDPEKGNGEGEDKVGDKVAADKVQAKASGTGMDEVEGVTAGRAKALGEVYRGSMAPFREIILASKSREECLMELARAYRDWSPERLVAELEEALQVAAAAGAAAATKAEG